MKYSMNYEDLVKKVKQQEETVVQLVRIVAATNNRISELQKKQQELDKSSLPK